MENEEIKEEINEEIIDLENESEIVDKKKIPLIAKIIFILIFIVILFNVMLFVFRTVDEKNRSPIAYKANGYEIVSYSKFVDKTVLASDYESLYDEEKAHMGSRYLYFKDDIEEELFSSYAQYLTNEEGFKSFKLVDGSISLVKFVGDDVLDIRFFIEKKDDIESLEIKFSTYDYIEEDFEWMEALDKQNIGSETL